MTASRRSAGALDTEVSPSRDSLGSPIAYSGVTDETMGYNVKASIVDCDVDSILSVTKSVTFEIDVVLSTADGFEGRWSVFRTESEFKLLYQRLKSCKNVMVPKIPSGKLTHRLSMTASERKTKNYQQFLESLCDIPELIKSDVMCSFLIGGFGDIIRSMKSGDSGTPMALTMNFRQTKNPMHADLKGEKKLADELSPPALGFDLASLDLKAQLAAAQRKVEELQKALKKRELEVSEMEGGHRALLSRIMKLKDEKKQLKSEVSELQEFVKAKLGAIAPAIAAAAAAGIGGTTSFSYESHKAADLACVDDNDDDDEAIPPPPRSEIGVDSSDSDD